MQWYAALHYSKKIRAGKQLSLFELDGIQALYDFLKRSVDSDLSNPVNRSYIPSSIKDPEAFVKSLESLINGAYDNPNLLADSDVQEENNEKPVKNIKSGNFLTDYHSDMKEVVSEESVFSEKEESQDFSDFSEKDEFLQGQIKEEPNIKEEPKKRIFEKPIFDIPKKKPKVGGVFSRLSKMSNKLKRR
jgi:hypothetical protein